MLHLLLEPRIQYKDTLAVDDIDIKIQAQIKEANILREYGFLKEAAKKYKTALKLSAENSKYILMPEPLYELVQTAVLVKDASIIENGILESVESDSFLDQMNWITNKITNTYSNYIVFMELLALEYVEMPSDKRDKKVKKVLEYVPKEYESTNLHEFISYYNVRMSQAFLPMIWKATQG